MRYALGIEYDGSGFFGWQTQREEPTVQATLERALTQVADHPVRVVCAGRTDTGVHAWCQVVHFDTHAERDERSWLLGVNSNLPETVAALWLRPVSDDFHARFSAIARSYRYVIFNHWLRPAIDRRRVCWQRHALDVEAMREAAGYLLGEHDFSSFRSAGCKANHPVRDLQSIELERLGRKITLSVTANGFLYHMVRNIAGTLMAVGQGDKPPAWVKDLLQARDRRLAGVTASPAGLYFAGVRYPPAFDIPHLPESLTEK